MYKTIKKSLRLCVFAMIVLPVFTGCTEKKQHTSDQIILSADSLAPQKFLDSLNKMIQQQPSNPEYYYERALLLFKTFNEHDGAFNDIMRAINLDSSVVKYYLLQADLYFAKANAKDAKKILEKCLSLEPVSVETHLKLAELYLLVEQYGKSIEQVNEALKADAHSAKAYFIKGMDYKLLGDTVKAISSMQTAVEQDNNYYDAFIQLGLLFASKKDSLAIAYYENALRIEPNSIEALYNKSFFLQEYGHYQPAIEGYQRIVELQPKHPLACFNMGYVNLVYLGNYEDGIREFTNAIEIKRDYYEAYTNRGICYEKLKDFKKAEADYRKALQIKPDYALAAKGISRVVDKEFQ